MKYLLYWQKALKLTMKTNLRVLTGQTPCFRERLGMQALSLSSNDCELLRRKVGKKRLY